MAETVRKQEPNGWHEWGRHVLKELERCDSRLSAMEKRLARIEANQAVLQTKAGIWGLMGGAITVIIALAVWLVKTQ